MQLHGLELSDKRISWLELDPLKRQPVLCDPEAPINALGGTSSNIMEDIYKMAGKRKFHGDRYRLSRTRIPILFEPNLNNFHNSPIATIDIFGQTPWIFPDNEHSDPSVGCAVAELLIPELQAANMREYLRVEPAVDDPWFFKKGEDCLINAVEIGIQQVWSLSQVIKRVNIELGSDLNEDQLRRAIFNRYQNSLVLETDIDVWIPPFPATFVILIGDYQALRTPEKPVVVRTHDVCTPSDVSGSQWCSCRPYLVPFYADAIKAAREGGCGILVYSTYTEGRGFNLPRKLSVYNHREAVGRTRPEHYFAASELICGLDDARLQFLHAPDVLRYLGVKEISEFHSMNPRKKAGIINSGIRIKKTKSVDLNLVSDESLAGELGAKKLFRGYH